MKVTRRQLRKFLLESLRTDQDVIGDNYLEVEMLTVIKQTTKIQMFATLHEKTKEYAASLGHQNKIVPVANAFETISAKKAKNPSATQPTPAKDNNGNYSFNTNSAKNSGLTKGQNNYYAGTRNISIAPKLQSATAMSEYLSDCYHISALKQDGDKLEYGSAAIIAHLLPGTTVTNLDGSDRGKDIVMQGSPIYFEVKKSDKAEPQTMLSGSPATTKTPNKYFIFITTERSYIVHSRLFAIVNSLSTDLIPTGVTIDANEEYNKAVLQYTQDYPEMLELAYQASLKTGSEREKIKLANDIFKNVNKSQRATLFLRKILFLSRLRQLGDQSMTEDIKEKLQTGIDAKFFTKDSRGNYSLKELDIITYTDVLPFLLHLSMISGAHSDAGEGKTERFPDMRMSQGEGTAGTWLRTQSDTKTGGNFFRSSQNPGILGNPKVPKAIQANWLLNFVNYSAVPQQQKIDLLNKIKNAKTQRRHLQSLKADKQTMEYVSLELLRNKAIFSDVLRNRSVLNPQSDFDLPSLEASKVDDLEAATDELFKLFTNYQRKNVEIDQKVMALFDISTSDLYRILVNSIPKDYLLRYGLRLPTTAPATEFLTSEPLPQGDLQFTVRGALDATKNNDLSLKESIVYGKILKELLTHSK